MKLALFHHGLPTFAIFLFISYQRLVVFVQTAHYDDSHNHPWHLHSSYHDTLNHDHESHTDSTYFSETHNYEQNLPESHNDAPHEFSESHIHEHTWPGSHTDAPQHPESHNDLPHDVSQSHTDLTHLPESNNDAPQQSESHVHFTNCHEPHAYEFHTDPSPSTFDNDLTHGSQTQETRNFILIITKNLMYRFATTRIPYSKLNHTNYWPFNMERVRLPSGYQSPINIHTNKIDKIDMPPLDTSSYEELDESAELICFNTGQTIECKVKNGTNAPYIQGGPLPAKYIFDNMHWHWGRGEVGSEHLIDGIPYAAEVHVVHYKEKYGSFEKARKKQDGLAIFALFAKISKNDNADLEIHFNEILRHMLVPSQICPSKWHDVFKFIHKIVLNNQQWMTYPGSLTSAPFKESVTWLVYFQCFDISLNQLDALRSTLTTDGRKHAVHRRPVYNLRGDNRPMLVRKSEQQE